MIQALHLISLQLRQEKKVKKKQKKTTTNFHFHVCLTTYIFLIGHADRYQIFDIIDFKYFEQFFFFLS